MRACICVVLRPSCDNKCKMFADKSIRVSGVKKWNFKLIAVERGGKEVVHISVEQVEKFEGYYETGKSIQIDCR